MCGSSTAEHKILGKRLNHSQGKNPSKKIGITVSIIKCKNCGLIYSNPQPIPASLQDHYGVPPEEYWKKEYFVINDQYFKNEITTLMKLQSFNKGAKALDIGAGLGKCMIALANAGFDSYGFEPSKPFYERAIQKMGIQSEKLKLGAIEDIEYPNDHFDFITFGAVLEHLYSPSESIYKAMTWLKSGGIMHIEVPSADWLVSKLFNTFYRLTGTDYVTNLSPMHEPFHLYEFSLKSFESNAPSNGYEIALSNYYVCQTYLSSFFDWFLVPIMKATNSGMQLCVWLRKK